MIPALTCVWTPNLVEARLARSNPIMNHSIFCIAIIATVSLYMTPSARSQNNIVEQANQGVELMKDKQWEAALEIHQAIVNQHGANALKRFGPMFGQVYFRKGFCELKLKQWTKAMESFRTCHVDFANAIDAQNRNDFESRSLLLWAQAAMGDKDWDLALELMDQFAEKHNPREGTFSEGDLLLGKATCHLKLGNLEKGTELFQFVLDNR